MTTLVTFKDKNQDGFDSQRPVTPEEIKRFIQKNGIEVVDFKFNDLPGLWQHFSMPASVLTDFEKPEKSVWSQGIGFDSSSIRGFKKIQESDMLLIPDPTTALADPVSHIPTLSVTCDIYDPLSKDPYSRDPRYIAKKAENYMRKSGIADTCLWGPEIEFFLFDDIRFAQSENYGYYFLDSKEGSWNTGKEENPNLGYKFHHQEGYFPVPPHDHLQDLRSEIMLTLRKAGVPVECHHHEVATGGQCEIDLSYAPLTKMGDHIMLAKYVIKNVARKYCKAATFMPKPLGGNNGSGMHVHTSLWKDGKNLFYDLKGYAQISETCKWFVGGLLRHTPALLAFGAPTINSYRRLAPGTEAAVNIAYSATNRSAVCKIPLYSALANDKRIEFRATDPSANSYLAFAAMLMAGLDGIRRKIDPGQPLDKDLNALSPAERAALRTVPASLEEALNALETGHGFLLEGDVFTRDVIETWISYKRQTEVEPMRSRPHPYEFHLYFDS